MEGSVAHLAAGLGAAFTIIGGGYGMGRRAGGALAGRARQRDAGCDIRPAFISPAALIEGVTFFALVICIMLALK